MQKNSFIIILIMMISFNLSADTPDDFNRHFNLMPNPQRIELLQGKGISYHELRTIVTATNIDQPVLPPLISDLPASGNSGPGSVSLILDNSLSLPSPEGYILEIKDKKVAVRAKQKAGLFYGLQTLQQLLEDARDQQIEIPACRITDFPEIAYRAVHLDMKHHVESGRYYYDLIDRLAGVKVNAIMVEMEDKLRYRKYPLIGAQNALSIDEFAALSRYANERFIEISPLIQGLGHASFILKHDAYKDLRDDPASDWVFDPLNPATYDLQFSLYEDAIAATPGGKYLHVGGDEVGSLGKSALSQQSGMKPFELQMYWLKKVSDFAVAHNRIPVFWDDMVFKLSNLYRTTYNPSIDNSTVDKLWKENQHLLNENLDLFPKNCVYMRWNYGQSKLPGNIKAIDWYASNNLQVMAATAAQTRWTLFPRNRSNFQPIKDFSQLTAEKKLNGILCTMWDDNSPHFETFWRGIFDFAFFSWNFEDEPAEKVHAGFRHRFYAPQLSAVSNDFQDQLEDAVTFWETVFVNKGDREDFQKEYDLIDLPVKNNIGQWSLKYREKLSGAANAIKQYEQIREKINHSQALARRNHYALEIMEQVNELQVFPSRLVLLLEKYDKAAAQNKSAVAAEINKLMNEFTALRTGFENAYSKTRILGNPPGYILDQNHHRHPANGTNNTDWLFMHDIPFLKKAGDWLKKEVKLQLN